MSQLLICVEEGERCGEVAGKVNEITTGDRKSIMPLGRETRRVEKINSDGGVCA
jgi:hypothetical protein